MMKTPLFIWIFIIIAIVASIHLPAMQFYLYWRFWWFDILTHFLGGLWISMSLLWLFFQSGFVNMLKNKKNHNLLVFFAGTFFIGVMWEIFEYYFGITFLDSSNYMTDTAMDLFFDLLGGFAAYCIFIFKKYDMEEIKN